MKVWIVMGCDDDWDSRPSIYAIFDDEKRARKYCDKKILEYDDDWNFDVYDGYEVRTKDWDKQQLINKKEKLLEQLKENESKLERVEGKLNDE